MGKLDDFIEKRGGLVMTISLIIHTLLLVVYTIIYIINDETSHEENKIFISGTLLIFIIYMIHFAYHSVKSYNFRYPRLILLN